MRRYVKTTGYYNNRKERKPPGTSLTEREIQFLNDILKLKHDNSDWDGKHRVDYDSKGDDGYGNLINKASKELSELDLKWSWTYQRKLKSRILRRRDKILADAELLKSVLERLERL